MAKYSAVKATVNAYIKQNGRKEITGKVLNAVLNATIDSLGKYFQFAGGASPTDDPGTPDQNVCYLAGEPGVYTNFGSITIENEEVALLFWDGEWTKQRILIGIREVNASVDNQVGTPSVDVSYSGGELVLTFHNLKGGQGETGDPAGFGTIGADINGGVGTPGVSVETSGDNTAKNLMFHFTNLKGETGVTSVVATIDDTSGTPSCQVSLVGQQLTLAFSGLKGLKGDTGVSADYPITIYNGLDSDATDQALAAAQGKVLDGKVSQLDDVVNGTSNPPQDVTPTTQLGYYYWNRNNVLTPDANGGSYYSGTVSGNAVSGGLDVSEYVGRTIKVIARGIGTTSQRLTAITDENNGLLVIVQEKDYAADGTDYSTTMTVPEGAKYFYWSGIGTLVSVIVSAGESRPGLVDEVHANTEKCVNFTIIPSDTQNLINPADVIEGYVYGTTGVYEYSENYWATGKLPVTAGAQYKVLCNSPYAGLDMYRHICFYGEDGATVVAGGITTSGASFTAPADAHFAVVSLFRKPNGVIISSEDYGVFAGVNPGWEPWYENKVEIPFVPLNKKTENSILTKKDLESIQDGGGALTVVVASPMVTISEGNNSIAITQNYEESREQDAGQGVYDNNTVFDFYTMTYNGVTVSSQIKDDVAPAHILGQTLGANHGQPCRKATITGHGLTNTAIGTAWVQDGVNFYVMRIVDADNIILLSENRGTETAPSWVNVSTGPITNGADTLTITAVSSVQLYPSIKNRQIKLVLDGVEISENGTHQGDILDIVETYEIMNPASILANIISRAGTSSDPTYDGDSSVKVEMIYRFVSGLSVLVISNFVPLGQMSFQDVMFSQAERKGNNGMVKYYVPNSLPFGGNDLRQPAAITWGSSVSDMYCDQSHSKDTTKPINRVIQYDSDLGFAIGFMVDKGVGKSLYDYTTNTFEIRGNTGKVYPHGVESSKVGTTLHLGQAYNAVLYRSPFVPSSSSSNRLSMYHFAYDGAEYVFIDYKGTITERVVINNSLNGKEITVLESQNTTLLTDVYNGGFYVRANFVEGETCYIIAKIK